MLSVCDLALRNTKTFEDGLVKVVNRGDDSDTAGAVTGALLGALYGANKIPERWLSVLRLKAEIENQYVRIMGEK